MAQISPANRSPALHTPLFDRFQSAQRAGLGSLARDIADILGSRRAVPGQAPGILGWGLPGIGGFSPSSDEDRQRLAKLIANTLNQFEPRLTDIRVVPEVSSGEFSFSVSAQLIEQSGRSIALRILAPRRGGGLGADVMVLGDQP